MLGGFCLSFEVRVLVEFHSALWLTLSRPVLFSALSVWMEQCASTASLLASVREQERQFEMLSRALEEERRSCAGTLPRPLPNMQVTWTKALPIYPHAHFPSENHSVSLFDPSKFIQCRLHGRLHPICANWQQHPNQTWGKIPPLWFQLVGVGLICV